MPSTQEVITNMIASTFNNWVEPRGIMIITKAQHTCMSVRGVNTPEVDSIVSVAKGAFLYTPAAREEFLSLIQGKI
jgi:GTP cyclohydrolase I